MGRVMREPTREEFDRLERIAESLSPPKMRRTQVCITEQQWRTLKTEATLKGISVSELIRRKLDTEGQS